MLQTMNITKNSRLINVISKNTLSRGFQTKCINLEQEKEAKANKMDAKVEQWLQETSSNFSIKTENPKDFLPVQYLGKNNAPFPMNPFFKPHKPVSEENKKKIFDYYKQNPKVNTPRKLGNIFRLSVKRVEAILKLKSLQEELITKGKEKFILQTNFQIGMEKLLGVSNMHDKEELEPILPEINKPLFRAIDEEVEFGAKDAAVSLNRKPFEQVKKELADEKPFEYHGLRGDKIPEMKTQVKILSKDEKGSHKKYQFMFSDINPNLSLKNRQVLIRETDGTLREASLFEKKHRAKLNSWPSQNWLFKPTPMDTLIEKAKQ
ncbi:hypothetical protein K502DRAFT_316846 [Neoconidiobolus thromboides FSU 785]|nr:hypothetical protein K502DRAFT_316846 [Neoconidiobolus thromboides FSU 785]